MKINPYGMGNAYPTQPLNKPQEAQNIQPQNIPTDSNDVANISEQELKLRKFTDGVKGANEMIGAMQIADITLNALGNQIKTGNSNITDLDNTAKATQFKNDSLFGRELSVSLANESVSISLPLPSTIAQNGDLTQGLLAKHDEISSKLSKISELIEKGSQPFVANGFDFENFDANAFKSMF